MLTRVAPSWLRLQGLLPHWTIPAVRLIPPCGIWDPQVAGYASLQDALAAGNEDAPALLASLQDRELEVIHEANQKAIGVPQRWVGAT